VEFVQEVLLIADVMNKVGSIHMAHPYRILPIILILVLAASCKNEVTNQPIKSDIEVETRIVDGQIEIVAYTVTRLPCANYTISYSKEMKGQSIRIRFKHINDLDFCLTAFGPATVHIPLNTLTDRTYDVTFILNGETTRGTLATSPLLLELEPDRNVRLKD